MKKFILKTALYMLPFIAVIVYCRVKLPVFYGNPSYIYKYDHAAELSSEFQMVVFGSSRSHKHISPVVLDSVLADKHIKTANLAMGGVFSGEGFFMLKQFLANPDFKPKYLLFELQVLNKIADGNVATKRTAYWCDNEELQFAKACLSKSNQFTKAGADSLLKNYYKANNGHNFNGSLIKNYLNVIRPEEKIEQEFSSYELLDTNHISDPIFAEARKYFVAHPQQIEERRLSNDPAYFTADSVDVYIERLQQLNAICNTKGIRFICLIPPRQDRYQSNYLLSVKNKVAGISIIDLSSPVEYPQFYNFNTSFDVGHMLGSQANEYSVVLAGALRNLIK